MSPFLWLRKKLFSKASSSSIIKPTDASQPASLQPLIPEQPPEIIEPRQSAKQPLYSDKQLIDDLVSEIGMSENEVAMVVNSYLQQFAQLIKKQSNLISPVLKFIMVATPGKLSGDGNTARTELKFARVVVIPPKPSEPV